MNISLMSLYVLESCISLQAFIFLTRQMQFLQLFLKGFVF